jgi:hypothetical protein
MINGTPSDYWTLGCMSTPSVRTLTGFAWALVPLLLLVYFIWSDLQGSFLSLSYYVVLWGSMVVLALSGFWFLIDGPGAKWVLRGAAGVVTLYTVFIFLIASGEAGRAGEHNYLMYSLMVVVVAFCAFTFFIAGRHAT